MKCYFKREYVYRIILTFMTVVWLIFMIFLSHENAEESGRITGAVADKIGEATVDTTEMKWCEKQEVFKEIHAVIRQISHVVVYFILAVLCTLTAKSWKIKWIFPFMFLIVWSIGDEVSKLLTEGRHCDVSDMVINILGSMIGFVTTSLIVYLINRKKDINGYQYAKYEYSTPHENKTE